MKHLIIFLFVLISFFISAQANAQQEKNSKWDLAFSYGLATPFGNFSKVIPEESFFTDYVGTKYFGFSKEGHGAAKNGQFFSLDLNFHINKHWFVSLIANQTKNAVYTQQMLDYVISIYGSRYGSISNSDYRVSSLAVGFGYQYDVKKISCRLSPIIGRAVLLNPDYNIAYLNTDHTFYYDVTNTDNSVLLGLNSSINYQISSKFYVGLKIDYRSADFNYTIRSHTHSDVVNYRLLQTGFTFGIRL